MTTGSKKTRIPKTESYVQNANIHGACLTAIKHANHINVCKKSKIRDCAKTFLRETRFLSSRVLADQPDCLNIHRTPKNGELRAKRQNNDHWKQKDADPKTENYEQKYKIHMACLTATQHPRNQTPTKHRNATKRTKGQKNE
eukprot:GEMP01123017.1.p1 GENE.GEMP01123017.1~~GEMP01123017.1.p1  ORF type:complete len:159 (+),score=8.06 GEMP01123017.1:54-479(+)